MNVGGNRGSLEAALSLPCGFITVIVEFPSPEGSDLGRGEPQPGGSEPPFPPTLLKPDCRLASLIAASFGPFPSARSFCIPEKVISASAAHRAHAWSWWSEHP